jgi:hypothetical protein
MNKAFGWAAKYNLKVIVDLHGKYSDLFAAQFMLSDLYHLGAPGSQNG